MEQAGLHQFTVAWKLYGVLRAVRTNLSGVAGSRSYTTVWYLLAVIPDQGELICCPAEFDYLILVVSVSITDHNKTWHLCVLHVLSVSLFEYFRQLF